MFLLEYKGNVEVFYKNKKNEGGSIIFRDEYLDFGRSTRIGITNLNKKESELISTLKLWKELDQLEGLTTYLKFISQPKVPMIDSYREYYIYKVVEEKQMVVLKWHDDY